MNARPRATLAALAAALLLAACGGSATPQPAPSQPAPAKPAAPATAQPAAAGLAKVTLRLPWTIAGYDAPFILAAAKGYYKDAGLDVNIQEGKGSAITGQTVGNGSDTFGFADAGVVAAEISKGLPVKVLAVFIQKTPFSFIYNKTHPFATQKELVGRPIIGSPSGATTHMLPAVLAKANMTEKDLKMQMMQADTYPEALKSNPSAVVLGFSNDDYLNIRQLSPDATFKSYADFGVNPYNSGVIASLSEIQNHPDQVRAFLAASVKGWEYAQQHPDEAAAATVKAFPQAKESVVLEGLQQSLALAHTQASARLPIGQMAPEDWQATIDLLHQYGGMDTVKPLDTYYTNEFLPKP